MMLRIYARRVAVGAVLSAALAAGFLGLTAAAASACGGSPECHGGPPPAAALISGCTSPECIRGVPPVAALAMECTDPKCISGTQPTAAPRPGNGVTGRPSHSGQSAPAAGVLSTGRSVASVHVGTSTAINCPPQPVTDPGKGGC